MFNEYRAYLYITLMVMRVIVFDRYRVRRRHIWLHRIMSFF